MKEILDGLIEPFWFLVRPSRTGYAARPGAHREQEICPHNSIAEGTIFILPSLRVSIFVFMYFITGF